MEVSRRRSTPTTSTARCIRAAASSCCSSIASRRPPPRRSASSTLPSRSRPSPTRCPPIGVAQPPAPLLLSGWVLGEYEALSAFANMMFWIGAGVVGGGMLLNAWGLVRQAAMKSQLNQISMPAGALRDGLLRPGGAGLLFRRRMASSTRSGRGGAKGGERMDSSCASRQNHPNFSACSPKRQVA